MSSASELTSESKILPEPEPEEMISDKGECIKGGPVSSGVIADDMKQSSGDEVLMVGEDEITEIGVKVAEGTVAADEETKREHVSYTINDIFTAINEDQRIRKKDNVDEAIICPLTKRIQLLTNKANIRKNYGYDIGEKTYLFPEEALYFLETHKLEVLVGSVPISIQRARSLLLNPGNDTLGTTFDGTTCGFDEYTVFKFLAKEGYRPRRTSKVISQQSKLVITSQPNIVSDFPSKPAVAQQSHDAGSEIQDVEMQSDPLTASSKESSDEVQIEAEVTNISVHSQDESDWHSGVKRKKADSSSSDNNVLCNEKRSKFYSSDQEMRPDDDAPNSTRVSDVILSSTREPSASPDIICDYQSPSTEMSGKVPSPSMLEEDSIDKNVGSYTNEFPGFPPEVMVEDSSSGSVSGLPVEEQDSDDEEPMPSTSRGSEPYTVLEVDSDVEFVDEVIFAHPGVQIEEIITSIGVYYETEGIEEDPDEILPDIDEPEQADEPEMTASFTEPRVGAHILVDLVSSDEEEEGVLNKSSVQLFSDQIWSKLVPHSTAALGLPPAELIPQGIRRKSSASSESVPPKEDDVQMEEQLGEIVVGLRIDSEEVDEDPLADPTPQLNGSHAKSWNDWRQESVGKAQDTFKRSLLGSNGLSHQNCDTDFAKLNLWRTESGQNGIGSVDAQVINDGDGSSGFKTPENYYKFDLYPPKHNKCGKVVLGTTVKPSHRLYIIREMEILISLSNLITSEDDIPLLVAVVNEDQNVTFVSPGSSGARNVFPIPNNQ